jgi:hypothetical protein
VTAWRGREVVVDDGGAKARKGHDMSNDGNSTSTAGDGRGSSSDNDTGRTTDTNNSGQPPPTAPAVANVTLASAPADQGDGTGSPTGPAAVKRVADVGPVPAAAGPADGESAGPAPARPAAPATGSPVVPLPVAGQLASARDQSSPAASPAAAPAGGTASVLATFGVSSAGPAALHGQAGPTNDGLETSPLPAGGLVRDGAQAEPADLGGEAPAEAAPADYAAFVPSPTPFAGALLDRLALDARALDEALQGFLRGLDRLGEQLSDPRARLGVSAWLLTAAGGLALLELHRRRRAAAAEADGVPLTWLDPEGPAPEPA